MPAVRGPDFQVTEGLGLPLVPAAATSIREVVVGPYPAVLYVMPSASAGANVLAWRQAGVTYTINMTNFPSPSTDLLMRIAGALSDASAK